MKRVYAKLKNGYIAYRTKDFAPDDEFWMEDVINIVNNYFPYEKTEKGYIFTDIPLEAIAYIDSAIKLVFGMYLLFFSKPSKKTPRF